ncbi:thioredoxin [Nitzschia inconspicua]|uniref:Thioredoxin n=1 Tax=Nitzschia inconspicua TaxID=303405 RepID=A0A9K3KD49_9STRA|nr:thioredoxin [Nitzschia inconspicua]
MIKPYKAPVQHSVGKLRSRSSGTSSSPPTSRKNSVATHNIASSTASSSTSPRSFEDRMRGILGQQQQEERQQQQGSTSSSLSRNLPSNLHYCHTLQQYKELVAEETDSLVFVGFFASEWCKACQAAVPWFHRMASLYPQIKFVHVPVTAQNVNLHQGLGVERLPSGHIYHPTLGLIEDNVRLTKSFLAGSQSRVAQLLQWYLQGSCELMGVGDTRDPMDMKPKTTVAVPKPVQVSTKTILN